MKLRINGFSWFGSINDVIPIFLPAAALLLIRGTQACGGLVANNRINRVLAVSRSFGDVQHKVVCICFTCPTCQ